MTIRLCRFRTTSIIKNSRYFIKYLIVNDQKYDDFVINIYNYVYTIQFDIFCSNNYNECIIYYDKKEIKIFFNKKNKIIKINNNKGETLIFFTDMGWRRITKFLAYCVTK